MLETYCGAARAAGRRDRDEAVATRVSGRRDRAKEDMAVIFDEVEQSQCARSFTSCVGGGPPRAHAEAAQS